MPVRHGMTIGELASLFNGENHLGAELHVITMKNWSRGDWFDSTGLHWIVLVHQALADEVGLNAPMAIVARSSGILRLLAVTTIDERIPVFRTEDEALTALRPVRR